MSPSSFHWKRFRLQEPDLPALRELYKTLEFSSLLREHRPGRDAVPPSAITSSCENRGRTRRLARRRYQRPVAIATGEMMSDTVLGFSGKPGAARTLAANAVNPARDHRP